ncbi:hypothetical protein [Catenulispora pinisilvae]|uniref:hypothetical protein n=1 Tax=Catenulispora pinisilvae TaxID=2705253 RepID=UPI00189213F5|nr:hypothetical protein [Catenulispora pinisilvae]
MGYISASDQLTVTTATDLKGAAADLQEHARRLRLLIQAYADVLGPVDDLDRPETWAGQFADTFGQTRRGWHDGLTTGGDAVLTMISMLNSDAFELQTRAQKAGSH